MKLFLILVFLFVTSARIFAQEDPKLLFEKSWNTTDDSDRRKLREMLVDSFPDSEYGLYSKGWLLIQEDKYKASLEFLDKAIGINNNFWQAYHIRANVYGILGETEKAILDLTSVLNINPDYADAYYVRGATYCYTGNKEKGCEDLTKAMGMGVDKAKNLIEKFCK